MQIDYRQPDYATVFEDRARKLEKLRSDPHLLEQVRLHYQTHPWDFVTDWGTTFEPRNIEIGLIPNIPLILWPRQVEYLQVAINPMAKTGERAPGEV